MVIKRVEAGYIYVFHNEIFNYYGDNFYKIGVTNNIKQRFSILNTSFPEVSEFKFISRKFKCKYSAEARLFELLDEYRIKKHKEYFNVDLDTIIENIELMEKESDIYDDTVERMTYTHLSAFVKCKNRTVFFKLIERSGNKYPVKIGDIVVHYAKDNYGKKQFMNSKKFKYAIETGNWELAPKTQYNEDETVFFNKPVEEPRNGYPVKIGDTVVHYASNQHSRTRFIESNKFKHVVETGNWKFS
jgi:hypothetical protein